MTRGVDIVVGGDRLARFQHEPGDAVPVPFDPDHSSLLSYFGAEFFGMSQQDLVINRAIDLEGGPSPLTLESGRSRFLSKQFFGNEFQTPELGVLAPSIGASDLDGKTRSLDLFPNSQFVKNPGDRR